MADFQSCIFPVLDGSLDSSTLWHSLSVPSHDLAILHFKSEQLDVSRLSFLKIAWALVLRCYMGSSSPIFGCASLEKMANRNSVTSGSDESVHLTCCRVVLDDTSTVLKMLEAMPSDSLVGFASERVGLLIKPIEDDLVMASAFNTALLYQIYESEYPAHSVELPIPTALQKLWKVS